MLTFFVFIMNVEQCNHLMLKLSGLLNRESRSNRNDDICTRRELTPIVPKDFSDDPLNPITLYRIPHFLWDTDSKSIYLPFILAVNHGKSALMNPFTRSVHMIELPCIPQDAGFWELVHTQTASSLRPLARRRLITARPECVFIRSRKPWVR